MNNRLNALKKHIFFEFMHEAGRVFIVVRYSKDVIIGNRGFTEDEKKNGITLVFNSRMNFSWDDYGLTAKLVFGTTPQRCFIPSDNIVAVYSPELMAQFTISPHQQHTRDQKTEVHKEEEISFSQSENVIKVDFTKKRK